MNLHDSSKKSFAIFFTFVSGVAERMLSTVISLTSVSSDYFSFKSRAVIRSTTLKMLCFFTKVAQSKKHFGEVQNLLSNQRCFFFLSMSVFIYMYDVFHHRAFYSPTLFYASKIFLSKYLN